MNYFERRYGKRADKCLANYTREEITEKIDDMFTNRNIDPKFKDIFIDYTCSFQYLYGDKIPTMMVLDKLERLNRIDYLPPDALCAGQLQSNSRKDIYNPTKDELRYPFAMLIQENLKDKDLKSIMYHEITHLISAQTYCLVEDEDFRVSRIGIDSGKTCLLNEVMTEFYTSRLLEHEHNLQYRGDFRFLLENSEHNPTYFKFTSQGYIFINQVGHIYDKAFKEELLEDMFLGSDRFRDATMSLNVSTLDIEKELEKAFVAGRDLDNGKNHDAELYKRQYAELEKPYETATNLSYNYLYNKYNCVSHTMADYIKDTKELQTVLPFVKDPSKSFGNSYDTKTNLNIQSLDIEIAMKQFMPELYQQRIDKGMGIFDRDQSTMDFLAIMSNLRERSSFLNSNSELSTISYWHVPEFDTKDERCLLFKTDSKYTAMYVNNIEKCENSLKLGFHDSVDLSWVGRIGHSSLSQQIRELIPDEYDTFYCRSLTAKGESPTYAIVASGNNCFKLDGDNLQPVALTEGKSFFGNIMNSIHIDAIKEVAVTSEDKKDIIRKTDIYELIDKDDKQTKEMYYKLAESSDIIKRFEYIVQSKSSEELVMAIINDGLDTNSKASNGTSLMQFTMDKNEYVTACRLIEAGADLSEINLNSTDKDGKALIHHAIEKQFMDVTCELIKANADIDIRNKDGQTALHIACQNGNLESIETLIKGGADTHIKDKDGKEPIELCEGIIKYFARNYFPKEIEQTEAKEKDKPSDKDIEFEL